jgi:hypothetical protein
MLSKWGKKIILVSKAGKLLKILNMLHKYFMG